MKKKTAINVPEIIEKKYNYPAKNLSENEENSTNFRKLIAEVIVEIITKRYRHGCDRVYKNK
jgi:hypothetical protein